MTSPQTRIGIDVGGTKIEAIALSPRGEILHRIRIDAPRDSYPATLQAIASLVLQLEAHTQTQATVGCGIPGSITAAGVVKNANSTWLNGKPLPVDLSTLLAREVRIANDANCLAISEAVDGAAAGAGLVFAVILGTGCGGGVALRGPEGVRVHNGPNGVAGEWGHNPLPWPTPEEQPGPPCYCGKLGCMETWVSGTGVARDYQASTGHALTTRELATAGTAEAEAALTRFEDRLARGLASVVHTLDPDVFVLGGGLSRMPRLYTNLPRLIELYLFGGGTFHTPIRPALHGDSSGVRGAAWLWPAP